MTDEAVVLVGATVIDGTGRDPIRHAAVVVRGGAIAEVGPGADAHVPHDAATYDVTGLTILPGLIDGHVHLRSSAGLGRRDPYLWTTDTFLEEQTLHAAANARRALLAGVTTVRDTAGGRVEVAVKHAVDDGVLDAARVVVSGFVGMTGGHGDLFTPPAIAERQWKTADGVDACRALVREHARDGVDLIKICTSGGILSVGDEAEWRNYTQEETDAIVDEAHALGKRVAAHAHTRSGIEQALLAGVDTLEHGSSLDDDLIERMLRQGTWLCPTLTITDLILTKGRERGVPESSLAKARSIEPRRIESARKAHAAGVPIFVGTDSSQTLPFGAHARELELLCDQVGMRPMQAIVSATRNGAAALGLADETGTLEPGKWADLLVVDGDPLADIAVLQRPERLIGVFRDGRLLVDRGLGQPSVRRGSRASRSPSPM